MCAIDLKHVPKRRCAPLERWRIPIGGSQRLERWRTHTLSFFTLGIVWDFGRGGSPYLTTWLPSPHTWCALPLHLVHLPPLGTLPFGYIIKHFPIAKASCSLGFVPLYYCCIIHIVGIKRLWKLHWCLLSCVELLCPMLNCEV